MDVNELLQLAGKIGPIIIGVATIGTVILVVVNLIKGRYRAVARARRAEKERDAAIVQRAAAEAGAQETRGARDHALQERDDARLESKKYYDAAKKNKDTSDHNLHAWKRWKARAEHVEQVARQYAKQIESVAKQDGRVWLARPRVPPPDFVSLSTRGGRRPVIISVFNLKGGVGKTTLTANLGAYLAKCQEKWVLLLDLDHQRSLTQTLFTTEKRKTAALAGRTIQEFFRSDGGGENLMQSAEQVEGEDFSRLFLVGNSDAMEAYGNTQNLDDLEMDLLGRWLVNPASRDIRYLLRGALHSPRIQERFDYVLIDCPPRLTTACINALAASDFLLIPTQADHVSARSVPHLFRRLRPLREVGVLPDLGIMGIVGTMASAAAARATSRETKVLNQYAALAKKLWGEPVPLLKTRIRDSDQYSRYQRDSEAKDKVQLPAVAVEAIRGQYEKLTQEMEGIIHDRIGVAGVPS